VLLGRKKLKINLYINFMKKYWQEFREFAVKGNVVDLAVAVIIGGAFGKIVSSLVADIVMPFIGFISGGVNFTSWKWILKAEILDEAGSVLKPAVTMNTGIFFQNIFDFLVIAASIFFIIKLLGRIKNRLVVEKKEIVEEQPAALSKDQELLSEIRDLLKNKELK
jgi:large conductance mechanosensitive channel